MSYIAVGVVNTDWLKPLRKSWSLFSNILFSWKICFSKNWSSWVLLMVCFRVGSQKNAMYYCGHLCVLELLDVTVAVLLIRETQCLICRWETPGVSGEVQRWICHSHWEPSQALPCPAGMGFSLCLSSCSSKDRHADVYVGEFLCYQSPLKCCLSFPSGGMGSACSYGIQAVSLHVEWSVCG